MAKIRVYLKSGAVISTIGKESFLLETQTEWAENFNDHNYVLTKLQGNDANALSAAIRASEVSAITVKSDQ